MGLLFETHKRIAVLGLVGDLDIGLNAANVNTSVVPSGERVGKIVCPSTTAATVRPSVTGRLVVMGA